MGYSSTIDFVNNNVVVFDNRISSTGFSHTGVNANIHYTDNRVVGFKLGIAMPTEGDSNILTRGYYDNTETNLLIQNTQKNRYRRMHINDPVFGPTAALNIDMSISFFSYNLRPAYPRGQNQQIRNVPDWRPLFANPNLVLGPN